MDEEKLVEIMVDHEDRLFSIEHSLKDGYMTKQTGSEIMLLLDRVTGDYKKINEELVHLGENLRRFEKDVNVRFDAVDARLISIENCGKK